MVAAISATPSSTTTRSNPKTSSQQEPITANTRRPPLLPSERDNGVISRKPKSKEITSRYMSTANSFSSSSSTSTFSSSSSSSFRRCPSPQTSTTTATTPLPLLKRAQSAERRRPVTPRPTTPLPDSRLPNNNNNGGGGGGSSAASKLLFTSTRSLSVSFQGESFSLPISKTKATPPPNNLSNVRKGTPERRRTTPLRTKGGDGGGGGDQMENSKPIDQHRWPGRTRQVMMNPSLTRSMDFTGEKKKIFGSGAVVQSLQQSMIDDGRRASFDGRLHPNSGNAVLARSVQLAVDTNSANNGSTVPSDLTASDTESVSSGSNSGSQECGGGGGIIKGRGGGGGPRGISVPARFWQETNSRLRRLQDPGSPLSSTSTTTPSRPITQPKLIPSRKSSLDSPISSPRNVSMNRALSSPVRGPGRPASPSRLMPSPAASPSRGMLSPARMRNAAATPMSSNQLSNTPSILSFAADVRRGKVGENRVVDAHLLRLLHNRQLQWRFVNARTDAALLVQRITAEKNLYNAWVTTSELRDSVTVKRIKVQLRRQHLKLTSILKGQMTYLEEWALLDRDHSSSLSGAIEALKASTLRLPVVGGARADIQNVKDAVGSAVDVMQAMASSICYLLSKVEEVNLLVAELANVTAQERALLDQCKDLLSTIAAMQVKDSSLRTHIVQLKRVSATSLTTPV